MKESIINAHENLIFRATFNDNQTELLNTGVSTDVTYNHGVAIFNGSSSKIDYNEYCTNVYSIRFKFNSLDSLTQAIAKLSSTISLSVNAGVITTTGITTPSIYINGKLNSTITATGGDVFIVSTTPFTIDDFVVGYDSTYFSGAIELVEFYNDAFVEGMVDAIYSRRYFTEHPADLELVKKMRSQGYIWVPGNKLYAGCENGFWVAKYEMKASKNINGRGLNVSDFPGMTSTYNTWFYDEDSNVSIVSTPEGSPIARITQTESIAACSAIGGHLITNNEWMTIVRNLEMVSSNWSTGTVGQGYIYSGHNDGTPGGALEASVDTNGYAGTGQTSGNQRRTLTLTNGEVIWDLSGNVWQWTSDTILRKDQPDGFNNSDDDVSNTGFNYFDYSKSTGGTLYLDSSDLGNTTLTYKDLFLFTSSDYNASTNGIGRIYTYSDRNDTSTTEYAFLRGGTWTHSSNAGVLNLGLNNTPGSRYYSFGVRCVK